MQVPVNSSSLNIRENFDFNENYSNGLNFDQFSLPSFNQIPYQSSQMNPLQDEHLMKQYAFSTDVFKPVVPSCNNSQISVNNFSSSFSNQNAGLPHYFNPSYQTMHRMPDTEIDFTNVGGNKRPRSRTGLDLKNKSSELDEPISLSTKETENNSFVSSSQVRVSSSKSDAKTVDKDDRYVQRRLKNNLAAKRSRDNRKRREDTIALRASYLEKTNLILQSQIIALKKEICLLRGLPFENFTCPNTPLAGNLASSEYTPNFSVSAPVLDDSCKNTNVQFPTNDFSGDCS